MEGIEEVPLLPSRGLRRDKGEGEWRSVFVQELKKVSFVAGPTVTVMVMQYLLQVVSMMMVGHLDDQLLLSGVSMATSFTSVTGFSLIVNSSSISLIFL